MALGIPKVDSQNRRAAGATPDQQRIAQWQGYGESLSKRLGVPVSLGSTVASPEGIIEVRIRLDLAQLTPEAKRALREEVRKVLPRDEMLVQLCNDGDTFERLKTVKGYAIRVFREGADDLSKNDARVDEIFSTSVSRTGTKFSIEPPREGWTAAATSQKPG